MGIILLLFPFLILFNMKWFKIKDKKPPKGEEVIILIAKRYRVFAFFNENDNTWTDTYSLNKIVTKPSHWMNAPKFPK